MPDDILELCDQLEHLWFSLVAITHNLGLWEARLAGREPTAAERPDVDTLLDQEREIRAKVRDVGHSLLQAGRQTNADPKDLAALISLLTMSRPQIFLPLASLFDRLKRHFIEARLSQAQPNVHFESKDHGRNTAERLESNAAQPGAVTGADAMQLKDRHINALEAMALLKATARDRRMTAQQIAVAADGPEADAESYKRAMADLVLFGYADSEQGRKGGAWITKAGRDALKEYKRTHK